LTITTTKTTTGKDKNAFFNRLQSPMSPSIATPHHQAMHQASSLVKCTRAIHFAAQMDAITVVAEFLLQNGVRSD
jgi:hypothetical protein